MCRPLLTSLILGPEGLAEGRAHVAEEDGLLAGFATWIETAGTMEPEDLFVDPGYMRRGIAAALGQGHDSALSQKRFVKFCTRRFRGNARECLSPRTTGTSALSAA